MLNSGGKRKFEGTDTSPQKRAENMKFSRQHANWSKVLREYEGDLRARFTIAEIVLELRVPDYMRATVHKVGGLWLQGPKITDKDCERAFLLNPEVDMDTVPRNLAASFERRYMEGSLREDDGSSSSTSVANNAVQLPAVNSSTSMDTPADNRPGRGTMGSLLSPGLGTASMSRFHTPKQSPGFQERLNIYEEPSNTRKIESLEELVDKWAAEVSKKRGEIVQKHIAYAREPVETKETKEVFESKMMLDEFQVQELTKKWDRAEKDLSDAKDDERTLQANNNKFVKTEFKKYQDECAKLIGWLIFTSDKNLCDQLKNNSEFVAAVAAKDALKVAYFTKHLTLDADTDRVQERNFDRVNTLMYTKQRQDQDMSDYASNFSEMLREYRELGGNNDETDFVLAICQNVNSKFSDVAKEWNLNMQGTRPRTVAAAFETLLHINTRWILKPEETKKKVYLGNINMMGKGMGNEEPRELNKERVGVCYQFQKDGRCRFGDRCKYKHEKGAEDQATKKSLQVCSYMLENGTCGKGEKCIRAYCHAVSYQMHEAWVAKKVEGKPAHAEQVL